MVDETPCTWLHMDYLRAPSYGYLLPRPRLDTARARLVAFAGLALAIRECQTQTHVPTRPRRAASPYPEIRSGEPCPDVRAGRLAVRAHGLPPQHLARHDPRRHEAAG